MSRILILGRNKEQETAFGSAELMAAKLTHLTNKHEFTNLDYSKIGFDLGLKPDVIDTARNQSLRIYDFVFIRDWFAEHREHALAISMWLEANKTPFLNTETLHNRSSSKLTQLMHMTLSGIPTTPTLNGSIEFVLQQIEAKLWQYPLIVKGRGSSRGRDNFLVNSAQEIINLFNQNKSDGLPEKFLIQPFIPNKGDYRFICYRGEIELVLYRQRQAASKSHLNNTSMGGQATLVDPKQIEKFPYFSTLKKNMHKISERWGRELTGIDAILDPETYAILEINNLPQLETGAFVNEKLSIFLQAMENEMHKS